MMKYATKIFNSGFPEFILKQKTRKLSHQSQRSSAINGIGPYLTKLLIQDNELQVKQHSDRSGNSWWTAYDPVTGSYSEFGSEAEIRVWIEQRYA